MKSFNLSAFVALSLVLGAFSAPTSTFFGASHVTAREETAANDEEFLGPLVRIGRKVLPKIISTAKTALPNVSRVVQKVAAPVAQDAGDVLGAADDVASDALPAVGSVLQDFARREIQNAAADAAPVAREEAGANDEDFIGPLLSIGSRVLPPNLRLPFLGRAVEDLVRREMQEADKKRRKKKVTKSKVNSRKAAVAVPPDADAATATDNEASTAATDATTDTDASLAASPDASIATDDLVTRDMEEQDKKKKKKTSEATAAPPSEDDAAPSADAEATDASDLLTRDIDDADLLPLRTLASLLRKFAIGKAAAVPAVAPAAEAATAIAAPAAVADVTADAADAI